MTFWASHEQNGGYTHFHTYYKYTLLLNINNKACHIIQKSTTSQLCDSVLNICTVTYYRVFSANQLPLSNWQYFTLMVTVAKRSILYPLRLSYWNKEVSTNVHSHNKCLLQSTFRCCTSELKHYHLISSAQSSLGTTEQNNALYEHRNIPVYTQHKWTASKCTSMLLYSLLSPPCNKTEHIKPLNFINLQNDSNILYAVYINECCNCNLYST